MCYPSPDCPQCLAGCAIMWSMLAIIMWSKPLPPIYAILVCVSIHILPTMAARRWAHRYARRSQVRAPHQNPQVHPT